MVDTFSRDLRRRVMQSVKSKNTAIENLVSKDLWRRGYRFRKNVKNLLGKPDLAIKKYKVVIFIDSCFWHGCSKHCRLPETNKKYWTNKINLNRKRDEKITNFYRENGWNIFRIWEHDLKNDFAGTIEKLISFLSTSKKSHKK